MSTVSQAATIEPQARAPRVRGAIALALACLAGVWSLAGLTAWRLHEVARAQGQASAQSTAVMAAAYVRQTLEAGGLVLHSMQALLAGAGITDEQAYRAFLEGPAATRSMRDRIANMKEVDKAAFIGCTGEVLGFSVVYPPPSINVADRDYLREQMGEAPPARSLSAAVPDRSTGKWTFFLAERVRSNVARGPLLALDRSAAGDRPFGVAIVGIKASLLSDFIGRSVLTPPGIVLLLRDDGVVLAGADIPTTVYGQKVSVVPPVSPELKSILPSGPVVTGVAAVDGFPARVVVLSVQRSVVAEARNWSLVIVGIAMLASTAILVAIWRSVSPAGRPRAP